MTHGGASITHDANGNLTSDGSTTFAYDVENRLISASGAKNATLAYDPLGRLASISSGGASERFLYDGDALVGGYGPTAGTVPDRRYVHGPGVDEPLVWIEGSAGSERRFLHADERGSIVAVTNDSANAIVVNKYDEYGFPSAFHGRFGYTGQAWLPELGLWYYKARFYDPKLGRFLQPDPIGYEAGMNLYAYVKGDPVNLTDPLGLFRRGDSLIFTYNYPHADGSGGAAPDNNAGYTCPSATICVVGTRLPVASFSDFSSTIAFDSFGEGTLQLAGVFDAEHAYPIGPYLICFTSQKGCNADILRARLPYHVVPNYNRYVRHGAMFPVYTGFRKFIGRVRTFYTHGGLGAVNVTLPGHLFHSGHVALLNYRQGGAWYIAGYGSGTNLSGVHAELNQFVGPSVFSASLQWYIADVRSRLGR